MTMERETKKEKQPRSRGAEVLYVASLPVEEQDLEVWRPPSPPAPPPSSEASTNEEVWRYVKQRRRFHASDALRVVFSTPAYGTEDIRFLLEGLLAVRPVGLLTLMLEGNYLTDAEVLLLAELLKANPQLTSLSLFSNRVGDEGAGALLEPLLQNPDHCLKFLDLSYNQLSDASINHLARLIGSSSTLETLRLKGNYDISDQGIRRTLEALQHSSNSTLQVLSFGEDATLDPTIGLNRFQELLQPAMRSARADCCVLSHR